MPTRETNNSVMSVRLAPMHRRVTRVAGFSMMEILVVILIAAALVALVTIPFASQARDAMKRNQTQAVLSALQAAAVEYYLKTSRHVMHYSTPALNWDESSASIVWHKNSGVGGTSTTGPNHSIERFLWVVLQEDSARAHIVALGPKYLVDSDNNGFLEVLDGWGNRIEYAAFVQHGTKTRTVRTGSTTSSTISIPDPYAGDNHLPEHGSVDNPQPFFASPGPDGQMGSAHATASAAQRKLAADNIYSFDLKTR